MTASTKYQREGTSEHHADAENDEEFLGHVRSSGSEARGVPGSNCRDDPFYEQIQ